ncbi:ABC transporter ATP-binding protein [Pacificoceanicola onchidii]|uniref:ABC transporter ATP-binding protein n=1 Tax=Pacificoceanicola onchidii TaxID=2562685 RepID=UPI0010A5C68C|nr:ABC transporter ATP-binding protein [Pacificoceanicola onchidii]
MSGVQLNDITKSYGAVNVIPPLNLSFDEGEFVVIVGPSGCGKSTTLRMIAGLEPVTSGSIHIAGKDVTWARPKERDIAMVFQSYALYPHMDVAGNMSFALRLAGTPKDEVEKRVKVAADMLELTEYLHRKPKDLSGGQRQRVAMGRAIVRDAYCFLFDEPLSNLDAKLRATMRTELAILHKKLDRTMVYVTHDQIEAMTMADRIVIMEKGNVQQVGSPREVYNNPKNLFVAGFIGSPSMNFLDAELQGAEPRIVGQGFDLALPPRLQQAVQNHGARNVVAGLRPEHFASTEAKGGTAESRFAPIALTVEVAEYIGSSQFLAANIGPKQVSAAIEVGPDSAPLQSGDYLFDTNRIYLFDKTTGEAVA